MAEQAFIVEEIKITGLQRISAGTVYNYFPVTVGDKFSFENVGPALRGLFKTGFFQDIWLEKEGNTLVVNVTERASIAKIIFEGNNDLSDEVLTDALSAIGLAEGKVFNRQLLDKVQIELQRQYFSQGKYALKIDAKVTQLTRNRVGINITLSEGQVARIKQVNIVGNTTFEEQQLLKEFELSTSGLLSFYTKDDQYSKQKLSADLERLRSFYLDRGFINFNVSSTQVAITPDKKEIYVTVNIAEGDVFTLEKVKLAGNLIVEPEQLISLVQVGPGEIFSRKRATETSKAISDRLGNEGYAFANVNMVPDIDNDNKTIDMTFFVDPGKKIYVRQINFKGNTRTRDEVLRREMRQMESSWASTKKIERSKVRLERLGYFEPGSVTVETPPVVGSADEIDVNYTVVEKASGNLSAGFGFSQNSGLVLNANVTQDNVFGSGKRINLAFNNSDITTLYRFGFHNPYFTTDGISLGYNLSYRETDSEEANTANYSTDVISAGANFGIPLNEHDRLRVNFDLKHTELNTDGTLSGNIDPSRLIVGFIDNPDPDGEDIPVNSNGDPVDANNPRDIDGNGVVDNSASSREVLDFVDENGDVYNTFTISIGWSHDTLNRAVFPTEGMQQRLSALATVPGSDLEFFKINYRHQNYFPLAKDLTLRLLGDFAYGDGYGDTSELPFFENYFAGGVQSVRGYDDNTLGPRDSRDDPIGGSTKVIGSVELFFPVPFLPETRSVRLGTFFDAGTVSDGFDIGSLRYSAGVSGAWLSPFGALSVSLALPLNAGADDEEQSFQFSFGSNF